MSETIKPTNLEKLYYCEGCLQIFKQSEVIITEAGNVTCKDCVNKHIEQDDATCEDSYTTHKCEQCKEYKSSGNYNMDGEFLCRDCHDPDKEDNLCEACDEEPGVHARHECGCKMICDRCIIRHDKECDDYKLFTSK